MDQFTAATRLRSRPLLALRRRLQLPAGDRYTQDWELELPEEFRTQEWFGRYLDTMEERCFDPVVSRLLMSLVLDVANDLAAAESLGPGQWERIEHELTRWPDVYAPLVEYWAAPSEPIEDCFSITRLVRRTLSQ